jgi:glycosyltransferase involved in cell wall biosynthesis
MIKISTITPCYKMGKYLPKFLEELQKQTIFPNFELVLDLNDPEPWELELVNKYIEMYPKGVIKLIVTSPVEPIGVSMNTCIKESNGDYLTIWNVDDLREPDSLEKQMKVLDENEDVDIVNSNFTIVTNFGDKTGQKIDHTIATENDYKRGMLLGPFFMFRKKICDKSGYFDEQLKSGADFDFAIRLAYNGKIMFSKGNGGFYLNEGMGASTSGNKQEIEKTFIYLRYGINDKIISEGCNVHLNKAMEYDIENIISYGKKINYKNYISKNNN